MSSSIVAERGSAPTLDRRTVLKIGAWSVPVIATAVAVPSAVASGECVDGPVDLTAMGWSAVGDLQSNWGNETTTGWIGSFQGAAGGNATQNVTGLTNGFLSQDDNDSATEIATVTMTISLPVVNGASYAFDLESSVGYGNPGGQQASARQSMVLDIVQPDATEENLLKLTVNHVGEAGITPSDAQMQADGYVLQNTWDGVATNPISFTATGTGTATLRFTFTIQPKIGTNRSDDISVGIPEFSTQACA